MQGYIQKEISNLFYLSNKILNKHQYGNVSV